MNGLKFIRTRMLNKTLNEFADLLGVTKQAAYLWESGKKKIPQNKVLGLKAKMFSAL